LQYSPNPSKRVIRRGDKRAAPAISDRAAGLTI
jgi:hypothetical protein